MHRMFRRLRQEGGYTLVELLGVGVVLLILGGLAVPSVMGAVNRTKVRSTIDTANKMRDALKNFYADSGQISVEPYYPPGFQTVEAGLLVTLNQGGTVYWSTPNSAVRNYNFIRYNSSSPYTTFTLCLRARDTAQTYVVIDNNGTVTTATSAPAACT